MPCCTYCDHIAETLDHVIPRAWSGNHSMAERYTVACCSECNGLLGAAPVHTIEERAAYLYMRYSKKYKRELSAAEWSTQELKQLSGNLKKQIIAKENHKKLINSKLLHIRKVARGWLTELCTE